jgi:hypothetical protein
VPSFQDLFSFAELAKPFGFIYISAGILIAQLCLKTADVLNMEDNLFHSLQDIGRNCSLPEAFICMRKHTSIGRFRSLQSAGVGCFELPAIGILLADPLHSSDGALEEGFALITARISSRIERIGFKGPILVVIGMDGESCFLRARI